jgi:Domain of unknown function DUF302
MGLVCHANAQRAAVGRGVTIKGNQVLMVFRNDFAVRLLAADPAAGFEAPIRIYVYENADAPPRCLIVRRVSSLRPTSTPRFRPWLESSTAFSRRSSSAAWPDADRRSPPISTRSCAARASGQTLGSHSRRPTSPTRWLPTTTDRRSRPAARRSRERPDVPPGSSRPPPMVSFAPRAQGSRKESRCTRATRSGRSRVSSPAGPSSRSTPRSDGVFPPTEGDSSTDRVALWNKPGGERVGKREPASERR